jgi:hypothetical protein
MLDICASFGRDILDLRFVISARDERASSKSPQCSAPVQIVANAGDQ